MTRHLTFRTDKTDTSRGEDFNTCADERSFLQKKQLALTY